MNIRGIELLRAAHLPGPRKEVIFTNADEVNLDSLYSGAEHDVAIAAFDYTEPIDQNPLLEKNVRRYEVPKERFGDTLVELASELSWKGVSGFKIVFMANQVYTPETIAYSGRSCIFMDRNRTGFFALDAIQSPRRQRSDFTPRFSYRCPVIDGRPVRSQGEAAKRDFEFPEGKLARAIRDTAKIPGNPCIDFEVYCDLFSKEELFYHDLHLTPSR